MTTEIIDKALDALHRARGLPAVERNVTSILQSITAGDTRDLVAHVVEDAALTQKVLKLANSPMYAPFAQEAGSVSSALEILGSDGLMHLALGTQMVNDAELAEDANLSQTLFASELARGARPDRIEDASTAAVMYDLGRLILTRCLPEESAHIDRQVSGGIDSETATRTVLGMSIQEFGSAIAQRWNLPDQVVSIIDGSGDADLVNIARFSTTVSSLLHEGKAEAAADLVSKADFPGLDKGRLADLIERKRETTIARPATRTAHAAQPTTAKLLQELLESLQADPRKTVDDLAGAMIPTLGQTLNTAHCLLFMVIRSGEFCVRYGFGKGVDELRSKLRVSAEFKPTAFHAAIKNNVDVSITNVLKLKPSSLPDGYHQLLPMVTRFLVLPIANSRVTGLLYCDWDDSGELQQAELAAIRQLRDLFLPFFPR
jgi:HD-like signal output (HDOD) protein